MALTITTIRQVGLWFYFLTGLSAIVAIGWMARRRIISLGVRLLGYGILINACWELALFTVWNRSYETIVSMPVHAVYQSLTEFGPLLLLAVLGLDRIGVLSLDYWSESEQTRIHRIVFTVAVSLLVIWCGVLLSQLLYAPKLLNDSILVYRDVTQWYFIAEAFLAVSVLGVAIKTRNKLAVLLFLVLGVFNVCFEVVGLLAGFRTYDGISSVMSIVIGLSESGTAAALVWMFATKRVYGIQGTDRIWTRMRR
jgi:hypothetical protein